MEKAQNANESNQSSNESKDQVGNDQTGEQKPETSEEKNEVEGKKDSKEMIPKESYEVVAQKYRKMKSEFDKLKGEREKAEENKLKESKKFEELYNKKDQELNELKSQYEKDKKASAIKMVSLNNKAKDPELVQKLINLDQIELDEDGNVNQDAVEEMIKGIQKEKPFLFGEADQSSPTDNLGSSGGANEGGGTGGVVTTMKRSELPIDHNEWKRQKITERRERGELTIIDDITPER
jgi:hypothetical protein